MTLCGTWLPAVHAKTADAFKAARVAPTEHCCQWNTNKLISWPAFLRAAS
jgi:hypothetical protein